MKKISIVVPCYNEEENVRPISEAILKQLDLLENYDYELIFIDNCSQDKTRSIIEKICAENSKVKAIFNAKNFGQFNSPYYGMLQASGDCVILICADFQDPVEMIPQFINEWENGYKIVCGIKATSKENKIARFLRTCCYKIIKKISNVEQIEHFTGFGLYDKAFVDICRDLHDSTPFLRGIVAELGFDRKDICYEQQKRKAGKTHNNLYTLYDAAMLALTSYSKITLRFATFFGLGIGIISVIIGLIYLVLKLIHWDSFSAGTTPILIGVFFFGAIQLFFIGLIGEYIMSINTRVMKRPLVVESKRINF